MRLRLHLSADAIQWRNGGWWASEGWYRSIDENGTDDQIRICQLRCYVVRRRQHIP